MRWLILVLSLLGLPASLLAATKPNVIIIMTDDQGLGDFSHMGNPVLKTPNMDALAKSSVRLTDFHVAPMCSPTRGQLMTGLAALRNGATSVCGANLPAAWHRHHARSLHEKRLRHRDIRQVAPRRHLPASAD